MLSLMVADSGIPPAKRPATLPEIAVGSEIELEIGPVAHGGHFIAHHQGMTIFVRGTDEGERVIVEITEVTKKIARAQVVKVLQTSANRITAKCQYFIDQACGGCDFQHLTLRHQQELKLKVVKESLRRIGGIAIEPVLINVKGDGFDWRTRMGFAISPGRRVSLFRHRSKSLTEVQRCEIAAHEIDISLINQELSKPDSHKKLQLVSKINVGIDSEGISHLSIGSPSSKMSQIRMRVFDEVFEISLESFWQPHRLAAELLVERMQSHLEIRGDDLVLDLYGGVGLFTAFIRKKLADTGGVKLIESDPSAISDARQKFKGDRRVEIIEADVKRAIAKIERCDLVLLDPPRVGASGEVIGEIGRLAPRQVLYISCDPATLARDSAGLLKLGYRLQSVEVLDLFPNTEHVESVANFIKD